MALNALVTMVTLVTASIVSPTSVVITILAMHMLIAHKMLEALNAHVDKDTPVTDILVTMSTNVMVQTHVMPMLPVIITLVDTAVNATLVSLEMVKTVMISMSAMAPHVTPMLNVSTPLAATNASVTAVLLTTMVTVQSVLTSMNVTKPMLVMLMPHVPT